jgi:hypothetical protein
MKLTYEQMDKLANHLLETTDSVERGLEVIGLEPANYFEDDVLDQLADRVERCQNCEWWCEPGELADDDDDLCGLCANCRPTKEE